MLNSSRDSLNPAINLETLKNRLWVAEHYRLLHGVEHAYWPHYLMRNVGGHLKKYKFNYAIKAFFIYQVYREVQNYRYTTSVAFLRTDQQFEHFGSIAWNGFLATALCLLIWSTWLKISISLNSRNDIELILGMFSRKPIFSLSLYLNDYLLNTQLSLALL